MQTDVVVEADDVVGDVPAGLGVVGVVLLPDTLHLQVHEEGSVPFPVEIGKSKNMTIAAIVTRDGGQQGIVLQMLKLGHAPVGHRDEVPDDLPRFFGPRITRDEWPRGHCLTDFERTVPGSGSPARSAASNVLRLRLINFSSQGGSSTYRGVREN